MKWSWFGRVAMALTSAVALGLSMTACGGGTVAYIWAVGTATEGGGQTNGQIVGYQVDDLGVLRFFQHADTLPRLAVDGGGGQRRGASQPRRRILR